MPRTKRKWISGKAGSLHIISRTARNDVMFNDDEKEYLMELIQRFASGFYVDIHAFCVMGTHFQIAEPGQASSRKTVKTVIVKLCV